MASGKSTWKYNKLLKGRRNYFSGIHGSSMIQRGIAANNPGIATEVQGLSGIYQEPVLNTDVVEAKRQAQLGNTGNGDIRKGSSIGSSVNAKGLAEAAMADLTKMANRIQGTDVKSMEKSLVANAYANEIGEQSKYMDLDGLISLYKNTPKLAYATRDDYGYQGTGAVIGDALMEGLEGSMTGLFGANGGRLAKPNKFMGGGPIGAIIGGVMGTATSLIGNLVRNHKIDKSLNNTVNPLIDYVNSFNDRSKVNMGDNIVDNLMSNLRANYIKAYGGPLDNWDGAIGYQFATDWLNNRKKQVNNKLSMNDYIKAFGGNLMTHGADWDTNLMYIGNGGSHESNPFEGVPMGVDQEGTPNLVEEGETIAKLDNPMLGDYVFSRRLKVPRGMRGKYKLGGPISFADASIKLAKEAEERPNDPISQRGLNALMQDLAIAQEEVKAKKEQNMFANGGKVNKFWGGGNTLKRYSGVAGYNAGKWMDDNGNYLEDYYTRVGKMDREAWQRHVDDQYKFWKDSNNKNTPRWKAIDNMYKANPWMKEYKVEDGDIESMATLARSNPGFMHPIDELQRQLDAESIENLPIRDFHYIKLGDGKVEELPKEAIPWEDTRDGYTWEERWGKQYRRANNGKYEEEVVPLGYDGIAREINRYYYYDPVETPATKSFYHFSDDPEFDGDVYSKIGQGYELDNKVEDETGTHYYYKPKATDEPMEMNKLEKLRGISALNNLGQLAYGLFAKPDYSNADAILEAVNNGQPFQPVGWKPIGDLMQNRAFDVERGINSLNNIFGSTVRAAQQNAGMNRGAGMAGILAASNQYMNSVGDLRQKALEYNDARYKEALDFNRATNMANSEGFLKADMANQSAMTDARKQNMSARVAAAEMRQGIKNAWDAGVNANLNSLFETAENMAWEAKNDNMLRRLLNKGYVPKDVYKAKGGKLKRVKRGLTF